MKSALLRDLCDFRHGGTPSKAVPAFWSGDIPWVSPKDMKAATVCDASDRISEEAVANSATSIAPIGSTLLVVRSGILAHTLPVALVTGPVAFNQDIKAVVPRSGDVSTAYIYWFLRSKASEVVARGVKKGATVHSVQSGFIESLQVPVPASDEQQRIVDLLARAEGIVRLRRQAQQKASEVIPAIFVDIFGDLAKNPKGWPVETIGDLSTYTRYGPRFHDRSYAENGARILRTTDMGYAGELAWQQSPKLAMSESELERYSLRPGTLLITRTGATIGKTALFRGATEPCIAGAYLIEIGLSDRVVPDFVLHALLGTYGQAQLSRGTRTVAQPNINVPAICSIRLPIPALEDQQRFDRFVREIESIVAQQHRAYEVASAAFGALLARAFSTSDPAAAVHEAGEALA